MNNQQVPKADSKFQKIVRANHKKWKLRLLSKGGQKADSGGSPYKVKPDYKMGKSAPDMIGEKQLNEIIKEEIKRALIEEGFLDDVVSKGKELYQKFTSMFSGDVKPSANLEELVSKYNLDPKSDLSLGRKELQDKFGGFEGYIEFLWKMFDENKSSLSGWSRDKTIDLIKQIAPKYGVEPYIIIGTMMGESGGMPVGIYSQTISSRGNPQAAISANSTAYGMGQIVHSTYESVKNQIGVPHYMIWIPEYGIEATIALISKLIKQRGSLEAAMASYAGSSGGGERKIAAIEKAKEQYGSLAESKKKGKDDRCVRIAKRKYKAWPSAYACVPESSSKALTKDGWKSVNELSLNEQILTFNIEKDVLEFKPILNIHRYKEAQTQVIQSGNNGFIFESTKNHKWVVKLPETISERKNKYERINNMTLIETEDLLQNKNNKLMVVSAPYSEGRNIKKNKIYKYGDNWVKYLLEADEGQRQAWLFSAIVYDGNQQKIERLTENSSLGELEWKYDGKNDKQTFGFKQKDVIHRDAFLLSAFLNQGLVTWKKAKDKEIYSCHYSSNKRYKNAANLKLVSENVTDVWCPQTENNTWVMMQETNGQGIITITGNSGAVVKCRQGKIWKGVSEGTEELDEEWSEKYKKSIDCKHPKGFSQKAHCQGRKKNEETDLEERKLGKPSSETNLGDWFKRKGAPGKKGGWVDCNTCRDGKCKPCGRQDGEKRSEYPRCRPTPSQCKGYKRRGDNLQKEEEQ